MPRPASVSDWTALQLCNTENSFQQQQLHRAISRGIANPNVEVSELLRAVAPMYLAREDSAELWTSPVVCAVTYDPAQRFVAIEEHLYSWEALRAFIVDVGHKKITDEVVAYGPSKTDRAFLQTDPLKAVITKSTTVDFGVDAPAIQKRSCADSPVRNAPRGPQEQKDEELTRVQRHPDAGEPTLANVQLVLWQAMHSADPDQLAKALTAARGWIDSSLFEIANRQLQVLLSKRGFQVGAVETGESAG